jgi:Heterokaryon incompatibility protein (HET)
MAWARKCISSCKDEHIICQNSAVPVPQTPFTPTRLLRVNKKDSQDVRLVDMTKLWNESTVEDGEEIEIQQVVESRRKIQNKMEAANSPEAYTDLNVTDELKVDYIALSHCWGGKIDSRLVKDNISAKMKSIDVNDLPKNFQHAVSITHQLGYEYLWIDSLCIIQDDQSDWKQESAKMGLVYSNAICVISATGSANSHGGCSFPKDPMDQDVVLRRNADFTLTVRSWIRDDKRLEQLFRENVEQAPLTSRGWTFQERILAKRVLHFSHSCVLFECNTHQASEYHEDGIPYLIKTTVRGDGKLHSTKEIQRLLAPDKQYVRKTVMVHHPGQSIRGGRDGGPYYGAAHTEPEIQVVKNPNYKSQRQKVSEIIRHSAHLGMRGSFELLLRFAGTSTIEKLEFHSSWYEMIEQYSTRQLTEASDKLMAIVGVAALIQQTTKLTFVAGLWKEALEFNLLWSTIPTKSRSGRPVPSWSWASIDGEVHHHLKNLEGSAPQISQLDVNDKSKGLVASSKQTIISNKNAFETSWHDVSLYISIIRVNSILRIDPLIHNATLRLSCRLLKRSAVDQVEFLPDITIDGEIPTLWYMPILSFSIRRSEDTLSAPQIHGLVIRSTENDAFERVGYFWTSDEDMMMKITGESKEITIIFQ